VGLGESWEEDHEQLLHTLGNLTLTNYNSELSNSTFAEKKVLFATSHVEMNRYFERIESWTPHTIERRAEVLSDIALSIWPYFGPQRVAEQGEADEVDVTGTIPSEVRVRIQLTTVDSWADVVVATMEGILQLGGEEFNRVAAELPRQINVDPTSFRRWSRPRRLSNGAYVETGLSAAAIYRFCIQAVQLAGLGPDEWSVAYAPVNRELSADDEGRLEPPSQVKQLQLDSWNMLRPVLQQTGHFPSLRTPRAQYWFDIALGRSSIWMSLTANVVEGRVGVKIVLAPDVADHALELLAHDQPAIEAEIGSALEWNPHPERRVKTIRITQAVQIDDRATWSQAANWLASTAVAFRQAFAPRIGRMELQRASVSVGGSAR
jgi:hypothetical protein